MHYTSNAIVRIRWTPLLRSYPSYYVALIFSRSDSNFSSIVRNPKRRKCLYSMRANNLECFSIFSCDAMITNLLIITSLLHFVLYVFTSSNRDKPVNTMSGLELRFPGDTGICIFAVPSERVLWPTLPRIQWLLALESNSWLQSIAELKNAWRYWWWWSSSSSSSIIIIMPPFSSQRIVQFTRAF